MVEVDELRTSIVGWAHDESSRVEARRLALEAIAGHLAAGRDVVVPQYLGRWGFIDDLAAVASLAGAEFVEVVLLAEAAVVADRFRRRRAAAGPDHPQADVADTEVGEVVEDALARLRVGVRQRGSTVVAADGDRDATVHRLRSALTPG